MAGNRQTLGAGATPDRRPAASQQPPGPTKLVPSEARKTGRSWDLNTLTGAQALSFDEVAETLSTRLGTHVPHVRVSPDAARDGTLRAGVEAWFAEDMARLHTMLAAGYEDVVTDDVAVATGTAPRSLAEFGSDIAERFAGRWGRGEMVVRKPRLVCAEPVCERKTFTQVRRACPPGGGPPGG